MKPLTNKNLEMTKVEKEAHLKDWARFLYGLYKNNKEIVKEVLKDE
jgi:hypothetical protein